MTIRVHQTTVDMKYARINRKLHHNSVIARARTDLTARADNLKCNFCRRLCLVAWLQILVEQIHCSDKFVCFINTPFLSAKMKVNKTNTLFILNVVRLLKISNTHLLFLYHDRVCFSMRSWEKTFICYPFYQARFLRHYAAAKISQLNCSFNCWRLISGA